MKHSALAIILILILPLSAALTITSPTADITAQTLPADVTVAWQGNSTQYGVHINTSTTTVINETTAQTSKTYSLTQGDYELTITAGNQSAKQSFTVQQDDLQLGISTGESEYEVSETVTLSATASRPVSATLTILREAETEETYTLSISDSLSLIYIPEEPGTYQAVLEAENQSATTQWEVTAPQPLTIDFTHTAPVVNKKTSFTASASGGEAPYTYQWVYSDDTASTGKTTTHYFFSAGEHNTTLIVTDDEGTQKSITKEFDVQETTYGLEITLINEQNDLLDEFIVQLTDSDNNTQSDETGLSGTVEFSDLTPDNYSVTVRKESQKYLTTDIEILEDTSKLYTIDYQTQEQQQEQQAQKTQKEDTEQTETVQQGPSEEELAEQQRIQELKAARTNAQEQLREKKFSLRLDSSTDEVLAHLGYYASFDQAISKLASAPDEDAIKKIQRELPTAVQIRNEEQTIIEPSKEDIEQALQEYLKTQGTEEGEQEKTAYNLRRVLEDVKITQKTYTATIRTPAGEQTHRFVHKEIEAPTRSAFVEVIPKSFAQTADELTIDAQYEVIKEDPIIKFNDNEYTYSAQNADAEPGTTLVIPEEFIEPPLFNGLIGLEVGESDVVRTIIYVVIIALAVVGVVAGRRMGSSQNETFEAFCELTNEALEQLNTGDAHTVAQLTPDIIDLHHGLSKDEQQQTRELVEHLNEQTHEYHFTQAMNHLYAIGEHADINTLSGAYEDALHAYEHLGEEQQERLSEHLRELEAYMDAHITSS